MKISFTYLGMHVREILGRNPSRNLLWPKSRGNIEVKM